MRHRNNTSSSSRSETNKTSVPLSPARKERVGVGAVWSIVSKTCLLCLAIHPRVQYTHSAVSSRVSDFCRRSVKCADGSNLRFTPNPEDGCFYYPDYLRCQRHPCSPELPHVDCCQHFITPCFSGPLIANWNILDSWAQYRFQSCFFSPYQERFRLLLHSPEI